MLWWQVFRRSDSARASAGPLLSRLTKVAAEGSAKVAQRAEGIQAALAVALAASASAKVDSTIPASFWESLAAPKAPLLSLATLARLSTQDAASQLLLAESLLLQVICILQPSFFSIQQAAARGRSLSAKGQPAEKESLTHLQCAECFASWSNGNQAVHAAHCHSSPSPRWDGQASRLQHRSPLREGSPAARRPAHCRISGAPAAGA